MAPQAINTKGNLRGLIVRTHRETSRRRFRNLERTMAQLGQGELMGCWKQPPPHHSTLLSRFAGTEQRCLVLAVSIQLAD